MPRALADGLGGLAVVGAVCVPGVRKQRNKGALVKLNPREVLRAAREYDLESGEITR